MSSISAIVKEYLPDLSSYQDLYKHLHSHPELSLQEKATAQTICDYLSKLSGYTVHAGIGGHGVAAVLKNGEGKTVLLRADIDALPVKEATGLEYASAVTMKDNDGIEKPVMHACGHDMHITSLLAAAETLHRAKDKWSGTLLLIFQPAEERAAGAQAMVDDGLYDKVPQPDIVLGAHVMPFRAGTIGTRHGLMASAADSQRVTLHGHQGHASQPHNTCDPAVMAASTVMRLQTLVSREVDPATAAVVTVGSLRAGDAENIIPETAELKINVRTVDAKVREHVLAGIKRIVEAESAASDAPKRPTFTPTSRFPFTVNDDKLTSALEHSFSTHFGEDKHSYTREVERLKGSEDFPILGTSIGKPCCYWVYGGTDPEHWDRCEREERLGKGVPINHSPFFAPVIMPTLKVGAEAYVVAALTWLAK